MRLMRLCRRKKRVLSLHSHGRMCHLRIVVVLPSAQRWMTRWLSLILPQGLPRNRTSPQSLGVREYVHTYISHINKLSLTALSHRTHTLVETKYYSSVFCNHFTEEVLISHSIIYTVQMCSFSLLHCIYKGNHLTQDVL